MKPLVVITALVLLSGCCALAWIAFDPDRQDEEEVSQVLWRFPIRFAVSMALLAIMGAVVQGLVERTIAWWNSH